MKKMPVFIIALMLTFTLCTGLALAQYAVCPPAKITDPVGKQLSAAYCLFIDNKLDKSQKMLEDVLKKDPGNPIALNNLAAIMVKKGKLDKADTYLNEALPKAKGMMVQVNRVCAVNNICVAIEPVTIGQGNQDLEQLIKFNLEMVRAKLAALKQPQQ
jgi:tetratricopeptide (TPR) repeat protein